MTDRDVLLDGGVPALHGSPMVRVGGHTFIMGTNDAIIPQDGEGVHIHHILFSCDTCAGPEREVYVDAFEIDVFEASNADFSAFVEATGYVTEAEVFGDSFVHELFISPEENAKITQMVSLL